MLTIVIKRPEDGHERWPPGLLPAVSLQKYDARMISPGEPGPPGNLGDDYVVCILSA
jgi:hypothetical protein